MKSNKTEKHTQICSLFVADGSTVIADVSHISEAHHVLTTHEMHSEFLSTQVRTHAPAIQATTHA